MVYTVSMWMDKNCAFALSISRVHTTESPFVALLCVRSRMSLFSVFHFPLASCSLYHLPLSVCLLGQRLWTWATERPFSGSSGVCRKIPTWTQQNHWLQLLDGGCQFESTMLAGSGTTMYYNNNKKGSYSWSTVVHGYIKISFRLQKALTCDYTHKGAVQLNCFRWQCESSEVNATFENVYSL